MKTKSKQTYLAPSTLVFEIVQEGVICQSPPTETFGAPLFNGFNEEELW